MRRYRTEPPGPLIWIQCPKRAKQYCAGRGRKGYFSGPEQPRKDIPALGGVTRNSNRLFETGAQVSSARQKISQETPEKNKRELLGHDLVRYF